MNEESPQLPNEVADKSQCGAALSISIGAGITFLLNFVPFLNSLCCLNYIIASLVAIAHYTSTHKIAIEIWHGIKIAFFGCLLGSVVSIIAQDVGLYLQYGTDLTPLKETILEQVRESAGGQKAVDIIDKYMPEELTAGAMALFVAFQLVISAISSFVGGAIGGSLGASFFKKGPLVK